MRSAKPFGERVEALRELLDVTHPDLDGLCGMPATKAQFRSGELGLWADRKAEASDFGACFKKTSSVHFPTHQ